jgi:hypothetical protein
MRSGWTTDRLSRLYERYRRRYWPRARRLRRFRIQVSELDDAWGQCEYETNTLHVDVRGQSDRHVRSTVLHEMIHAVVGRGGHAAPFWTQLEHLLKGKAPITVDFPELGERGEQLCVIPRRFRRARRRFAVAYDRRVRAIERRCMSSQTWRYTYGDMENQCEDAAALDGASWSPIWQHQAHTWGFVDLDGRLLPSAKPWRDAARRGGSRGRAFYREAQRAEALRRERIALTWPAG